MARKLRISRNGFYHVINRGVARANIYRCMDDFKKFLVIMQEVSEDYNFEIFSFCLMSNHYHLLIKIKKENLSAIMQKINSKYSIYFNKKYNRVGPLWQGRFKSWFVYDENYLKTLVRYIEFNPIKANIAQSIGQYRWAMSFGNFKYSMLNYELIKKIDFNKDFNEKEEYNLLEFLNRNLEINDDNIYIKKLLPLDEYFKNYSKEIAIYKAIQDGYKQTDIAKFLKLSNVTISKIVRIYKQKVKLFTKLRDKGIFWSYSKSIDYERTGDSLFIEYLLKYGDFDDIVLGFKLFGKRVMKRIWEEKLKSDKQFIKLNLMLARVFFGMDVEASYFKELKNARFEKLKLLAS